MAKAQRSPWEYRDGPQVGRDVPITSEPRDEEAPGVPRGARSEHGDGNGTSSTADPGDSRGQSTETEEREVRAGDPQLTAETNARLTEELREAVGADRARVPKSRPHASKGEQPIKQGGIAYLTQNRWQFIRATAIVLTFGGIVSLITNNWWLLPLAAGIHALGTMLVVLTILRLTTISEHPSPELGAALAEEGVGSPDERFSEMVEEFRAEPEGAVGEVLSPGHNERTAEASQDPATASAEQSTAMTPTAQPSEPGGEGGTPDYVIWATAASLIIVSFIVPPLQGTTWMWLLPAIMVPLVIGWVALQAAMINRGDSVQITSKKPLVAIALGTMVAVAAFCAVVAFAFQH